MQQARPVRGCPRSEQGQELHPVSYQVAQNGTSYKVELKATIDRPIPESSTLEDLLAWLQRKGYEIKRGKYISARAPDQDRLTHLKILLGANYTEEAVVFHIAGVPLTSRHPHSISGRSARLLIFRTISKAQQSAGYQRWATLRT